jgi:hypothetical protein
MAVCRQWWCVQWWLQTWYSIDYDVVLLVYNISIGGTSIGVLKFEIWHVLTTYYNYVIDIWNSFVQYSWMWHGNWLWPGRMLNNWMWRGRIVISVEIDVVDLSYTWKSMSRFQHRVQILIPSSRPSQLCLGLRSRSSSIYHTVSRVWYVLTTNGWKHATAW